jgi:hypothetical protein
MYHVICVITNNIIILYSVYTSQTDIIMYYEIFKLINDELKFSRKGNN